MRDTLRQFLAANEYGVFPFFEYNAVVGADWFLSFQRVSSDLLTVAWSDTLTTYKADDVRQTVSTFTNQTYIGYPDKVLGFCVRKYCGFTYP